MENFKMKNKFWKLSSLLMLTAGCVLGSACFNSSYAVPNSLLSNRFFDDFIVSANRKGFDNWGAVEKYVREEQNAIDSARKASEARAELTAKDKQKVDEIVAKRANNSTALDFFDGFGSLDVFNDDFFSGFSDFSKLSKSIDESFKRMNEHMKSAFSKMAPKLPSGVNLKDPQLIILDDSGRQVENIGLNKERQDLFKRTLKDTGSLDSAIEALIRNAGFSSDFSNKWKNDGYTVYVITDSGQYCKNGSVKKSSDGKGFFSSRQSSSMITSGDGVDMGSEKGLSLFDKFLNGTLPDVPRLPAASDSSSKSTSNSSSKSTDDGVVHTV